MRTNIVIDDELMAKAMKATGLKTKRETVAVALEKLVDLDAQREFRSLRGKIKWVGDLDAMRRD
jgi:Arc/MetJ family transcription regulator